MDAARFTHSQFHSQFHSRRYSLRITLKYTTLVRMRIGPREPAWHDNGGGSDERPPVAYSYLCYHPILCEYDLVMFDL